MFNDKLDGERRERHRHQHYQVIANGSRRARADIRKMRIIDPERAVDEPSELAVTKTRFELNEQPVSRRPATAESTRQRRRK